MEVGAGSVWATMNVEGAVARIDAATNEVIARIEVGAGPQGLAIGSGSVWVASSEQATLSRDRRPRLDHPHERHRPA